MKLSINKKLCHQELTGSQIKENKQKSKKRIRVKHGISFMKKYRFLADRLHAHDYDLYDDVLEICAGLWDPLKNIRLVHRNKSIKYDIFN